MSGVQPSDEDNGVVGGVLGVVFGLAVVGLGGYMYSISGDRRVLLAFGGFGAFILLLAGSNLAQHLSELETRRPAVVVKKDLNDRDEVLRGTVTLGLFWCGAFLFWQFALSRTSPGYPSLGDLATRPEVVAVWAALNAWLLLGVMFANRRRGIG